MPADLIEAYVALYREHDTTRIPAVIAHDFVDHSLPQFSGRDGVARGIATLHQRLRDVAITIEQSLTAGDRAAFLFTIDGMQEAARVRIRGADFVRIVDGRIAELWTVQSFEPPR